jgi:PAS domain S-box-containing protein/putative nucleotidyltransferase with HDIG domain
MKLNGIVMTPEILSRVQDILVLRADDGTILDANPAALATYGYTIEQIKNLRLEDLQIPQTEAEVLECLRVSAERGGLFRAIHRRADESVFPVELATVPVVVDDEPALLIIVHDTTEREELEVKLRESKAMLQSIIDMAPLLVCVTSLDGRYILVNKSMEDMLGQQGETLVGQLRADAMPKDRAEEYTVHDRAVIRSRKSGSFVELYDGPEGKQTYLTTRFPLLDDDGGIASVCAVSVDITATRRVEAELAAANTRLEGVVKETASVVGRIVEARDPYTQGHENRVAELATMIAVEMGLPDGEVEGIEVAGLLHDIGKMGVPAEILSKPGGLSKEQYALVQCHPTDGHEILKGIDFQWPVAEAVLQHHERMDGSGYPQGLHGDEISTMARILAVADVVEAITSHRPYRPALGIEAAMAEINEHPEKYDQDVAAALLRVRQSGRIPL